MTHAAGAQVVESHAREVFGHRHAWTGGNAAFGMARAIVILWLISGPAFGYSDTWQLVINTGTTIVWSQ